MSAVVLWIFVMFLAYFRDNNQDIITSPSPYIREVSGGTLWGASDRDQEGRCNVTMVEATVQCEGFGYRKEKTSRSKTQIFRRVVV